MNAINRMSIEGSINDLQTSNPPMFVIEFTDEQNRPGSVCVSAEVALKLFLHEANLPNPIRINPTLDRVIIEQIEKEDIVRNGIELPAETENSMRFAKVVAKGDKAEYCRIGDEILYREGSGEEIYIGGDPYLIVVEKDVFAIL